MNGLPRPVLDAVRSGTDWFGSWWPTAVLGLVAAGLVVWGLRRRGRGRRAWPALIGAVAALAVGVTGGVNAYAGYLPSWQAARIFLGLTHHAGDGGRVVEREVPGVGHLEVSGQTYVYTPPGYDPDGAQRYPVLYLAHGSPGKETDWVTAGQIQNTLDVLIRSGLIPPMIAVAPNLNGPHSLDTECLDSTRPGGPQVATWFSKDLPAWVDAHYRTVPDSAHRIVGGFSMGGYCALNLGLSTDTFGVVVAISPADGPGEAGLEMLGSQAAVDAASPSRYAARVPLDHAPAVFIADGSRSPKADLAAQRQVAETLAERGVPVQLRVEEGQTHVWRMAKVSMAYGLLFAAEHLPPAP